MGYFLIDFILPEALPNMQHLKYVTLIVLALSLAACASNQPEIWKGTSRVQGQTFGLTLTLKRAGSELSGSYLVGSSRGSFDGTLTGDSLEATLTPSSTCSYSLGGTMTETAIDGSFAPDDCAGGDSGTWTLRKQ